MAQEHATLHELERIHAALISAHLVATRKLAPLLDQRARADGGLQRRIDQLCAECNRLSDEKSEARDAFVAEWKRLGCPSCVAGCTR